MLWCGWLGGRKGVKNEWWGAGMVICLERDTDLYMAQLMPLSLASVKSRLVLPFWYRLTWVVMENGPLNACVYHMGTSVVCFIRDTHKCCLLFNFSRFWDFCQTWADRNLWASVLSPFSNLSANCTICPQICVCCPYTISLSLWILCGEN